MGSKNINCVVAFVGGDQTRTWIQELNVWYCSIPVEEAKLLFEIHNRMYDEYNDEKNDTSYLGLDNLEEEVILARKKMRENKEENVDYSEIAYNEEDKYSGYLKAIDKNPDRYECIKKYLIKDEEFFDLKNIISNYIVKTESYYWLNQTHVSQDEYMENYDCNHWYEICELYEGSELPFDVSDEDIVSIFGFNKFVAFADMSYGC